MKTLVPLILFFTLNLAIASENPSPKNSGADCSFLLQAAKENVSLQEMLAKIKKRPRGTEAVSAFTRDYLAALLKESRGGMASSIKTPSRANLVIINSKELFDTLGFYAKAHSFKSPELGSEPTSAIIRYSRPINDFDVSADLNLMALIPSIDIDPIYGPGVYLVQKTSNNKFLYLRHLSQGNHGAQYKEVEFLQQPLIRVKRQFSLINRSYEDYEFFETTKASDKLAPPLSLSGQVQKVYGQLTAFGDNLYIGYDAETKKDDVIFLNPSTGEAKILFSLSEHPILSSIYSEKIEAFKMDLTKSPQILLFNGDHMIVIDALNHTVEQKDLPTWDYMFDIDGIIPIRKSFDNKNHFDKSKNPTALSSYQNSVAVGISEMKENRTVDFLFKPIPAPVPAKRQNFISLKTIQDYHGLYTLPRKHPFSDFSVNGDQNIFLLKISYRMTPASGHGVIVARLTKRGYLKPLALIGEKFDWNKEDYTDLAFIESSNIARLKITRIPKGQANEQDILFYDMNNKVTEMESLSKKAKQKFATVDIISDHVFIARHQNSDQYSIIYHHPLTNKFITFYTGRLPPSFKQQMKETLSADINFEKEELVLLTSQFRFVIDRSVPEGRITSIEENHSDDFKKMHDLKLDQFLAVGVKLGGKKPALGKIIGGLYFGVSEVTDDGSVNIMISPLKDP